MKQITLPHIGGKRGRDAPAAGSEGDRGPRDDAPGPGEPARGAWEGSLPDPRPVPCARREELLAGLLPFAVTPPEARRALARALGEERYPVGARVVREGEVGDRLYIIAAGQAEVSARGPDGPEGSVALGTLGAGAMFGELALLYPAHRRQATVQALTPLVLLALSGGAFAATMEAYPLVRAIAAAHAEVLALTSFLKTASPFAALDADDLRRLAAHIKTRSVGPGEVIVRAGDRGGYACYVVRRGCVAVCAVGSDGQEQLRAVLGAGSVFGERGPLDATPRTATVRALEPCDLLVLHQPQLVAAVRSDRRVRRRIEEVLRAQDLSRALRE